MWNQGRWLLLAALASMNAQASETEGLTRSIYRCVSGEAVTFSDRPCDAAAEVYETGPPVNTYQPPKPASPARLSTVTRPRAVARPDRQAAAKAEKCQRIQASLRDIRSRMRTGYTAREGERLRERQSTLEQQRRAAECR